MGLCVVMNRCAAVEGGAEGGEERIGEREEVDSTQMGGEELEVVCACMCWRDYGFGVDDYWCDSSLTTKSLLCGSFVPFFGD